MTRKEHEITTTCKHTKTAYKRFFKKYPEMLDSWEGQFEYMEENKTEHFSDEILANGKYNQNWTYSIWLTIDEEKDRTKTIYISITERN